LSDHGFPIAGVYGQLSFYKVRMPAPRPNPSLDGKGIPLYPARSSVLAVTGCFSSSDTVVDMAL